MKHHLDVTKLTLMVEYIHSPDASPLPEAQLTKRKDVDTQDQWPGKKPRHPCCHDQSGYVGRYHGMATLSLWRAWLSSHDYLQGPLCPLSLVHSSPFS